MGCVLVCGGQRFLVALSLAEGETLRRLIHTDEELLRSIFFGTGYWQVPARGRCGGRDHIPRSEPVQ